MIAYRIHFANCGGFLALKPHVLCNKVTYAQRYLTQGRFRHILWRCIAETERRESMAVTINSSLKDLLADPKAKVILEKHFPGFSGNPQLQMAMGMTLKQIQPFSQGAITDEKLKLVEQDLKKI
jgi:hypothetical protein